MTASDERTSGRPLSDMDPTGRFSGRATDYVRFRPDYPAAAIDAVLAGFDPARATAADVGAGTGISSRQLAERGVRVIAIEPNQAMRDAAAPHANVEWRAGTAEATGLADASVDIVLCAQAFHWFRPAEALVEFGRILRPGGRLVLLWNHRDDRDALTRGYIDAIHAAQGGVHPAEMRAIDPAILAAHGPFESADTITVPHAQALDRDGLIGRAASSSYVTPAGASFEELKRRLGELFDRHRDAEGRVRMRYETILLVARRSG